MKSPCWYTNAVWGVSLDLPTINCRVGELADILLGKGRDGIVKYDPVSPNYGELGFLERKSDVVYVYGLDKDLRAVFPWPDDWLTLYD